jgi:hypothetical protein
MLKKRRMLYSAMGMVFALNLLFGIKVLALTDVIKGADVQASPETVKAIMTAFDHAEEALQNKDLVKMMDFYSDAYRNRGLRKEGTSWIWEDIFVRYDQLSSRHVFSKILVDSKKGTAQVTCTGALFGISVLKKGDKPSPAAMTAEPVMIDSWFEAVHYLILEKGTWKIIGHDPAVGKEGTFGAGIHLLF